MENRFKMNFIDLQLFAMSCIPSTTISRMDFWDRLNDVYYHDMTHYEHKRIFDAIVKQDSFNLKNEDCDYFFCRFYKFNQYVLTVTALGAKHTTTQMEAFKFQDKYYVSKNQWVNKSCIVDVKPKQI